MCIVGLVLSSERKGPGVVRHDAAWINNEPAIVSRVGDRLLFTTSVETDGNRLVDRIV